MNYTRGQRISREKTMRSLIKQSDITPDGADWLTLRLDPYHDFMRPICGYPDADCYDTVVSVLNYETNVSAPAGAAANWDAHIFTLPMVSKNLQNGTITAGNFVEAAATFALGLVNVAKDDTGAPLFPTANPVASANFSCARVDNFTGVKAGLSRVIGLGIEVIDTTAELYKQGALTAYRMPTSQNEETQLGYLNLAGTVQSTGQYRVLTTPPSTVAEAVLYKGSVQWEAKDGAYMVVGQEGINNPFKQSLSSATIVASDTVFNAAADILASARTATTLPQAPPLLTATFSAEADKNVNCSQSGIMLTGLHNDATFKVRVRVFVERAPLRGDTDLIPLATPSAVYDSKALELYSKLVSTLPVCVPVSFNAKGDWWRWILRQLKVVAPVVGGLFGPEGAVIGTSVGNAIGSVSKLAEDKNRANKRRLAIQPRRRPLPGGPIGPNR